MPETPTLFLTVPHEVSVASGVVAARARMIASPPSVPRAVAAN